MSAKQVDAMLAKAKREDGKYDGEIIAQMNAAGIYFHFMPEGVRWSRTN
jgi:hypothetical protein